MSGTFEHMDVPPTLVSFAVAPGENNRMISPEFKGAGHTVRLVACDAHDTAALKANWDKVLAAMAEGKVLSAWALGLGGVAEGLFKMALGNRLGVHMLDSYEADPFAWQFGSLLMECTEDCQLGVPVAQTTEEYTFVRGGESLDLADPAGAVRGQAGQGVRLPRPQPARRTEKLSYAAAQSAWPRR